LSQLVLIASSDDYLVEESLNDAVAAAGEALGGAEIERLADDVTPEQVALELRSPSLFAPTRVLVVTDARGWLDTTAPRGALVTGKGEDAEPLLQALTDGVPDGTALVMGAWCGRKPKGKLVKAVESGGEYRWIPLPDPPKPWEDVVLSNDQRRVLSSLLRKVAGDTPFSPEAERLLLDRLGFEPRRLVSEAGKMAAAAGGAMVDEELVRRLVFPRARSLEVVRDAVMQRTPVVLLDLIDAGAAGVTVNDWQGRPVSADRLGGVLCGQVTNLLIQLLELRRVADAAGIADQLTPQETGRDRWYQRVFSKQVAPKLVAELEDTAVTSLARKGKLPTTWTLGQLARGASLYSDDELVRALAASGDVEIAQRGAVGLEALTAWIVRSIGRNSRQ
jgi:hypothetical protein